MMSKLLIIISLSVIAQGQILFPGRYDLSRSSSADNTESGLQSNVVIEIKAQGDSAVWLGTGRGLSVLRDSTSIETFLTTDNINISETSLLPVGGTSGIAVSGNNVLISTATVKEDNPAGAGLNLTTNASDSSATWTYFEQPKDSSSDSTFFWYGDTLRAFPITLEIGNVTYDIAVDDNYFWIASFYGGLRRLNRNDIDSGWERVPLPEDDMPEFLCGEEYPDYKLNSQEPAQGGNRNHRAFSVIAYNDTLWVGTADGINKGIMYSDGCIDWLHYSYPVSGISGNWVVGMAKQSVGSQRKIWAVTLRADEEGEINGISYTPDDGLTWYSVEQFRGERGYNLFAHDSLVYVASSSGLWRSNDGVNFAKYTPAVDDENDDQILDDGVYSVLFDEREYYGGEMLWTGTGDGLARKPNSNSDNSDWQIYRTNIDPQKVYAYPNPFSPNLDNQLSGEGYIRFHTNIKRSNLIKVNIFNFAMEKVRSFDYWKGKGEGTLKWDGRDNAGNMVANGPYFCNIFYDNEDHWVKEAVLK